MRIKRSDGTNGITRGQAYGWDERDYRLVSDLEQLPSYGLISGCMGNPKVSLKDVIRIVEEHANKRFLEGRNG